MPFKSLRPLLVVVVLTLVALAVRRRRVLGA